ncbi:hypothetical protein [Pontibacter beigongshangensis]|uniref:hypothetical protein n=1 Tax=Pontibacter beigongshangensis TaxID=2574733 RepID=UPI0016505FF1|nr:hypothetical protein [Pontibacter beigongshangensis]
MKWNINRPELICWTFAPLLPLLGLFTCTHSTDIHLHDTYFMVNNLDMGIFSGALLGLLGLGYWVMFKLNRRLSVILSGVHLASTVGGILFIMFLTTLVAEKKVDLQPTGDHLFLAFLIIITGQFFYVANLLVGSLRR